MPIIVSLEQGGSLDILTSDMQHIGGCGDESKDGGYYGRGKVHECK